MSSEKEALDEYMAQQQRTINDLTQMVVLLQTRNTLLGKELLNYRGYIFEKNENPRSSIVNLIHSSNGRLDVENIKKIDSFTTAKPSIPVEREGFSGPKEEKPAHENRNIKIV